MQEIVVITGGAGRIASALRPRLEKPGRTIRLLDVKEPAVPMGADEEFHRVGVTDLAGTTEACRGAKALIHLGGDPSERPWPELAETNITGTYTAFESARQAGVSHVFFASSLHCVGYNTLQAASKLDVLPPRPDTLYGVTKAAGEAVGSMYADRFGLRVVAARIMEFSDKPTTPRHAYTWLSPDDAARLVEASMSITKPGFHLVWGSSRNSRSTVPFEPGERMGYFPEDDADTHLRGHSTEETGGEGIDPALETIAGNFIDHAHPVGKDWTELA